MEVVLLALQGYVQARVALEQSLPLRRKWLFSRRGRNPSREPSASSHRSQPEFDRYIVLSSGLFDADFYQAENEDVVRSGLDPLYHFLTYGALEGRRPGPIFDPARYLQEYGDVKEDGVNPLVHFIRYGVLEGREAGLLGDLPRPVPVASPAGPSADGTSALTELAQVVKMGCGLPLDTLSDLGRILRSGALISTQEQEVASAEARRLAAQLEERSLQLYTTTSSLQRAVSRNDALNQALTEAQLTAEAQASEKQRWAARLDSVELERDALTRAAEAQVDSARDTALLLEATSVKLYTTTSSLQRAVSRNDELMLAGAEAQLALEARSSQVQDLMARLDGLEIEREDLLRSTGMQAATAQNLAARLEQTTLQLEAASSSSQRANSRNDELTRALQSERLTLRERETEARAQVAELTKQYEGLQDQLAAWQAKCGEHAAAAQAALSQAGIAEQERDQTREEAERLNADLALRATELREAQSELVTLQVNGEELEAAAKASMTRIGVLEREVEQARAEAQRFKAEAVADTAEVSKLYAELNLLQREAERLRLEEKRLAQTRAELDDMHSRVAGLERDAERGREHEAALIASRAEVAVLAERAAAARQELEVARTEAPALAEVVEELKRGLGSVASAEVVSTQLVDVRDRLASRLELLTYEIEDVRRGGEKRKAGGSDVSRRLYLNLLEAALTGVLTRDGNMSPWSSEMFDADRRLYGRDWPRSAKTMIGTARMRNLRRLVEQALTDGVEGDLLEAGVWRGGACIYMRGILAAYAVRNRTVWVADSFAGLPPPNPNRYPADKGDLHHTFVDLSVPLEEVKKNFEEFGLLDKQVAFLPGWFKDTLPGAPVERLAILRLDGDMYGSTMESLEALYPKLSRGGFVIVDDYILANCRKAVDDFREQRRILDPLTDVDGAAAYWRKS